MTQKKVLLLMLIGIILLFLRSYLMAADEAFLRRTSKQVWAVIGLQLAPSKSIRNPSKAGPIKPSSKYPPNYTLDQRIQKYGTGEARTQQFVQTPTNYYFVPSIPVEPGSHDLKKKGPKK